MKANNITRSIALLGLIALPIWWLSVETPARANIINQDQADVVQKLCALGRTAEAHGDLSGELRRFLASGSIHGSGTYRDVGAILDKISSSNVGLEFYTAYLGCVEQQTATAGSRAHLQEAIEQAIARAEEQQTSTAIENSTIGDCSPIVNNATGGVAITMNGSCN